MTANILPSNNYNGISTIKVHIGALLHTNTFKAHTANLNKLFWDNSRLIHRCFVTYIKTHTAKC